MVVSLPPKLGVSPFWFIRIFENKFPYISVTDEARDFKFSKPLRFTKAHHKIPNRKSGRGPELGKLPKILESPFNISATAEASDFKIRTQLGFAKGHHKITPKEISGRGPGLGKLVKILAFPSNISAMAKASDFKFGTQLRFAKAHHKITP